MAKSNQTSLKVRVSKNPACSPYHLGLRLKFTSEISNTRYACITMSYSNITIYIKLYEELNYSFLHCCYLDTYATILSPFYCFDLHLLIVSSWYIASRQHIQAHLTYPINPRIQTIYRSQTLEYKTDTPSRPLLNMDKLFHKNFPCFHYFHFFFKLVGIFIAISMKVRRYSDYYFLPQKTSANTRGLQWLVDFLWANLSIFIALSMIVNLYIPNFKRLCDTFSIVATLFMDFV
jgi:hypothetical protein